MKKIVLLFLSIIIAFSCRIQNDNLEIFANNFVKAVLAVGIFDKNYVDAYLGPDSLKEIVKKWNPTLQKIYDFVQYNIDELKKTNINNRDQKRKNHLIKMLTSVKYRIELLQGKQFTFDEESKYLYDIIAPTRNFKEYDRILDTLDKILPGKGEISERYEKFKSKFIIPDYKIDTIFRIAIQESQKRTKNHIKLPDNERFILEYVTNKPWGGYNWFKGNSESLIQINLDLPIYIDRAISLACHEGYPGHHVYHSLIEEIFTKKLGWLEYSVYPLFSPEAVLSEGTANYGITVAFPDKERLEFEKNLLLPLAGLDSTEIEQYYEIKKIVEKLDYATVDIARLYIDKQINDEQAIKLLMKYKLRSRKHA